MERSASHTGSNVPVPDPVPSSTAPMFPYPSTHNSLSSEVLEALLSLELLRLLERGCEEGFRFPEHFMQSVPLWTIK